MGRCIMLRALVAGAVWVAVVGSVWGQSPPSASAATKKVLLVSDNLGAYDEGRSRLVNLLEGMGLPFDMIGHDKLPALKLAEYQLIIVAGTSKRELHVGEASEAVLVDALRAGSNLLWVGGGIWGTFKTTNLPEAFGLRYVVQKSSGKLGISFAEYANLNGQNDRLAVYDETLYEVEPVKATVVHKFLGPDGANRKYPAITSYRPGPGSGMAVYCAMQMLNFWKASDSPDAYARAEVLMKYIRRLTTQGIVGKHPVADAKDAAFILRLEDYVPGGEQMAHTSRNWLARMRRLLSLCQQEQLPLNIAVIPLYRDPYRGETHAWDDPDEAVVALRQLAKAAFDEGGSLIVHGLFHQMGQGPHNYSGDDWEMWVDAEKTFLPLAQQQRITDGAFAEVVKQWGLRPSIWETPHYIGNADTIRAAARSGFRYFTESDTKPFPNRDGYMGQAHGLLLNIPETAFNYPKEPDAICKSGLTRQLGLLPQLARMNALVYLFYHNTSTHQERALMNLFTTARGYDLWKPSLEEYARFWEKRDRVQVDASIDAAAGQIAIQVQRPFSGFTLSVRLPDGCAPGDVTLDGRRIECRSRQIDGIWFVYPVLPEAPSCRVLVTYRK